jgi:hypothetical protein
MKVSIVLSAMLLATPCRALAQAKHDFSAAPPLYLTGICEPFLADCQTPDIKFTPTKITLARSVVNGTWNSSCKGTTNSLPARTVVCSGEQLDGANGENPNPPNPCVILLSGPSGLEPEAVTDDWLETVTPQGVVTVTCSYNPNEKV